MTRAAARNPGARLFIACWPDGATLQALGAAAAGLRWPEGARPTPPERVHLTLHFIGSVPEPRIEAIAAALDVRAVALPAPRAPIELAFTRLAEWRNGLAVLEAEATPLPLAALHAALAAALRSLGLPVERSALRAHVTLARDAAGFDPSAWSGALHWPVRGYSLVRSSAGYRTLRDYPLDAA
jgi:2'-5' RNA ligase